MDNWDAGRQAHLALSDAAAEQYDDLYDDQANFATGSYMRYELNTISRFINDCPNHHLAIDLGCGTGRDSFEMARHFDQVYAYDFSPAMIRVANRKKLHSRFGNVLYEVRDVEDGPLPLRDETAAFVNTAFGMGSFMKNLEPLFREIRRVLSPRGIAVFSFYNSNALVNMLELEWRPALAARVVPNEDALDVDFDGKRYQIAARAYTPQEIKKRISGNFRLLEITTFPTLSALFPQSLFQHEQAQKLCNEVDMLLSRNLDIAAGPYIIAVCQKGGTAPKATSSAGYQRVLELLRFHNVTQDVREHAPVRTMSDVFEVLNDVPEIMLKSILIAYRPNNDYDIRDAKLFLFGIPAQRRLDLGKVAKLLEYKRGDLYLADQMEVEEITGFKVGSIPPFGLPRRISIIIDRSFEDKKHVWCGTGKSTESLRVTIENLKLLSSCMFADVSRPQ